MRRNIPLRLFLVSSAISLFVPFNSVSAAIVIDGNANEPEWSQAQTFKDFRQLQPLTEQAAPATLAAEAKLLSTPEGIAVAITALHPVDIVRSRARTQRDFRESVDRLNFMIDFNADGRVAYDFTVSLAGAISDETITNEVEFNADWDAEWQYAVHETEAGYSVEWLIPWSIAAMSDSAADTRTIAVYFDRVIGATGERYGYPVASFTRPRFVSDFARIEIPQFQQSLLAITPYGVALQDIKNNDRNLKAGVDVFWKPNGDHQFAATINPDFGQVESDQLVVNFDAIETFFTDKRPFFTENQSYFDVQQPGGQLFYTRRVGGPADDGSGAASIHAAVKANGSFDDFGYGVFAASEDDAAGRDFYLLRGTHSDEELVLGVTQTWVERPFLDREAGVTSIDATWKPNTEWNIRPGIVYSDTQTQGETARDLGGGVIADWDMPGPWRQQYFLIHAGDQLQLNDLGYQDRNNSNYLEWESGYRQDQLPEESPWSSHSWEFEFADQWNTNGLNLRRTIAAQRYSERKDGGNMFALIRHRQAGWDDLISRGNGLVRKAAGTGFFIERWRPRQGDGRWDFYWNVDIGPNFNDGFRYGGGVEPRLHFNDRLHLSLGLFFDVADHWLLWQGDSNFGDFTSRRINLSSNLNWFISNKQELRVKLETIAINANARQSYTLASDGRLNQSSGTLADFNVRNLGFQVRYRYQLAPLSDLFVVYSRGGFANENRSDDLAHLLGDAFSLRDDDQFLIKLAYRFTP